MPEPKKRGRPPKERKFVVQRHDWLPEDEANMRDLIETEYFTSLKKLFGNQIAGANEDILNCTENEEQTVRDCLQRIGENLSLLDYFEGLKNEST